MENKILKKIEEQEKNKNEVYLQGTVLTEPAFDHEINDKKFYNFLLKTRRKSNCFDIIPVYFEEYFLRYIKKGLRVSIVGKAMIIKNHDSNSIKNRTFKVKMLAFGDFSDPDKDLNEFVFQGYISNIYSLRNIRNGERKVLDFLVKNNYRQYYSMFSCIALDSVAEKVNSMNKGDFISANGKIQKRKFIKKDEKTGKKISKEIFEIVIKNIEKQN